MSSVTASSVVHSDLNSSIIKTVGEIKDKRAQALEGYKSNLGISSFGGPQDLFRQPFYKPLCQKVVDTWLAFVAVVAGAVGIFVTPGFGVTAIVLGTACAASVGVLTGGLIVGGVLVGGGVTFGVVELIGRIVKRILIGKEEKKIQKLDQIKDTQTLTTHWKELNQGDRYLFLVKIIDDPAMKGVYESLAQAQALNAKEVKYLSGAGLISQGHFAGGQKEIAYFAKQSVSLTYLREKSFEQLCKMNASIHTTVMVSALKESFFKDLDHCRENLSFIPLLPNFAKVLTKEERDSLLPRLIKSLSDEAQKVQKTGSEKEKLALLESFDRVFAIVPYLVDKDFQKIKELSETGVRESAWPFNPIDQRLANMIVVFDKLKASL